jgi:hypothetical protein
MSWSCFVCWRPINSPDAPGMLLGDRENRPLCEGCLTDAINLLRLLHDRTCVLRAQFEREQRERKKDQVRDHGCFYP